MHILSSLYSLYSAYVARLEFHRFRDCLWRTTRPSVACFDDQGLPDLASVSHFTNYELTEVCTPGKNHGFSVSVMLMICTTCCSNVISSVADGKYPTKVQFGRSAAASGSSGMVLLEIHCLKLLRFLWVLRLEAGRPMMKPSTAIAAGLHRSTGFTAPVHAWTDQLPWNAKC